MSLARKLAIALTISLALNVFAGGFLVARAVYGRGHGDRARHGPFIGPHGLLGDDPRGPETRGRVERVMRRHGGRLEADRRELRQARRAVREALSAEPFDRAALEAALAQIRAQTSESQAAMHAALVELAESLPLEERRRLGRRARRGD